MAKPQSNEAKLPVIIAMVFFILTTLGLGVFAYTLSQDVAQANQKAADAEKKSTADATEKTKIQEEVLLYKVAMGTQTPDEAAKLTGLTDAAAFREKHTKLLQSMNARLAAAKKGELDKIPPGGAAITLSDAMAYVWEWPANQQNPTVPRESVIDASVRNVAQRELAKRRSDEEVKLLDNMKKSLETAVTQFNTAKGELEKLNKKYPEDVQAEVQKAIANFEVFKKSFQDASGTYRSDVDKITQEGVQKDFTIKRVTNDLSRFKDANDRLRSQLDAEIDPFQYDKPKAKVIRRYSDNLIDVDIGSADNLRTGQTFSIYPSDTPTRGFQPRMRMVKDQDGKMVNRPIPKGTAEVVEVLGAQLAQCRLTSEDSQIRDRIIGGDLLYNSVWNKGASEHVVLFGIFDIDGDGRDDIQTIVQSLTKVGVAVDGYYDLATMKWVGEITSKTTFAVEGYYPTVGIADGNRDGKINILTKLSEVKKLAIEKGLRILRPRDFFPRIGYNAKLDISDAAINSAATYYLRAGGNQPAPDSPGTPPAATPPAGENPPADPKKPN